MRTEDREPVGLCSCGKQLYAVFNKEGERIGISHTGEDEEHHFEYFLALTANPELN